jgi:hypothetical protein
LLLALLRTLWRLSYQELYDWLVTWPALALAGGLPPGPDGQPRVPSKAQQSKRGRAAGALASEVLFVLLVRAGLWMGLTRARDLIIDSAPILAWRRVDQAGTADASHAPPCPCGGRLQARAALPAAGLRPDVDPDEGIANTLTRVALAHLHAHDLRERALALRRAQE